MASNLVEMFNPALNWVTMIVDDPSARVVVFGVSIRGHFFLEALLGVVVVILLGFVSLGYIIREVISVSCWFDFSALNGLEYNICDITFKQVAQRIGFKV